MGMGDDLQVAPFHRRMQVGRRGGGAETVLRGDLVEPHALLRRAVEIRVRGMAGGDGRGDIGARQRMHLLPDRPHRDRSAPRPPLVPPGEIVLHPSEMRQQILVGPARVPRLRPEVIVARLPPDEHHRVDGGRSAQHLAPRPVGAAAVQPGLGVGVVAPVQPGVIERRAVTDGHANPGMQIRPAGLQHGDAETRALRQASGDHAARGPRPDDSHVGFDDIHVSPVDSQPG